MFGVAYETAVVIVGVVMITYVPFAGMLATTGVQDRLGGKSAFDT